MRPLITAGLLASPVLAFAHGDHDVSPHTHGELLVVVAIALVGLAIGWPLLRKALRQRR